MGKGPLGQTWKWSYHARKKHSARLKAAFARRAKKNLIQEIVAIEGDNHPVINGYIPLTVGNARILINSKINETVKIG